MKKTILFIAFALYSYLNVYSQATSMTVDCQTPGWLSSMINYGDQQTLKNIKVTGYINAADLSFIGSLNWNQQLNGVIDLENVQIVGATNDDNNKITQGYFGNHIDRLILPISLVSINRCLQSSTKYTAVDTLVVGGEGLPSITSSMFYANITSADGIRFNKYVKHLVLREGVTTIERYAFGNHSWHQTNEADCVFESVTFPSSLVTIKESAFQECFALKKANLTDNIEEIGLKAFAATKIYSDNDTISLPSKLKVLNLASFDAKGNLHYHVPNSVEIVNCNSITLFGSYEKCYLHIANSNPPALSADYRSVYQYIVAYVPKNSVDIYKNDPSWKDATILAEPNPAKNIIIGQESIEIAKGNSVQLNAVVFPEDADDKEYNWSSSNMNVVSVSQDGLITALSSGEAKIYATLKVNNTIVDSCMVKVYQPVTDIKLNISSKSVNVGDSFNLYATVNPTDADNKNVVWSSENSEIASVENGKVVALKPGVVVIYAKSEYNNQIFAYCEVTISQPVTGVSVSPNTYTLNNIGDLVQLEALVLPGDASNKNIKWTSSNESVCIVSNGTVVAVGEGTCVIIVTTEDGGYIATCTVTVTNATGISSIQNDGITFQIYDTNGAKRANFQRGVNIIRFADGTMKKILIK